MKWHDQKITLFKLNSYQSLDPDMGVEEWQSRMSRDVMSFHPIMEHYSSSREHSYIKLLHNLV